MASSRRHVDKLWEMKTKICEFVLLKWMYFFQSLKTFLLLLSSRSVTETKISRCLLNCCVFASESRERKSLRIFFSSHFQQRYKVYLQIPISEKAAVHSRNAKRGIEKKFHKNYSIAASQFIFDTFFQITKKLCDRFPNAMQKEWRRTKQTIKQRWNITLSDHTQSIFRETDVKGIENPSNPEIP